jgi:hypothetical protein
MKSVETTRHLQTSSYVAEVFLPTRASAYYCNENASDKCECVCLRSIIK